jgi:hypothetical protein
MAPLFLLLVGVSEYYFFLKQWFKLSVISHMSRCLFQLSMLVILFKCYKTVHEMYFKEFDSSELPPQEAFILGRHWSVSP